MHGLDQESMLKLSAILFILIKGKDLIVFIAWLCLTFKKSLCCVEAFVVTILLKRIACG